VTFFHRGDGWACSFVEVDAKTPVGPIRQFGTADKVRELIARTPTRFDLAGKQALEYAFQNGRGGTYLELTAEQYRKLKG
jgi:hypothetical protein